MKTARTASHSPSRAPLGTNWNEMDALNLPAISSDAYHAPMESTDEFFTSGEALPQHLGLGRPSRLQHRRRAVTTTPANGESPNGVKGGLALRAPQAARRGSSPREPAACSTLAASHRDAALRSASRSGTKGGSSLRSKSRGVSPPVGSPTESRWGGPHATCWMGGDRLPPGILANVIQ